MTADRITWLCDGCGTAVDDGTGHIWIDPREASRYERDLNEWRRAHEEDSPLGKVCNLTPTAVESMPSRPVWRVLHRDCDDQITASAYWFDIERCRTHAQLLDWTTHLWGKDWAHLTAWDSLIRRAIGRVDA